MKTILQLFLLYMLFTNSLYGKETILYPIYNIRLDKINDFYMKLLKIEEIKLPVAKGWPPIEKTFYTINLNNLLLIQNDDVNNDFVYFTLGKIIINSNNKLSYKHFYVDDKGVRRNSLNIDNKIIELKKNISYINNENFTLEEIKENLDVDLINEQLGKKLYENKQIKLSTKDATNNLINCRFCEQMIDMYSIMYGCYKYSLCNDTNVNAILIKSNYISRGTIGNNRVLIEFYNEIKEKGNIYKQIDKKYIAKTYKEWKIIIQNEELE